MTVKVYVLRNHTISDDNGARIERRAGRVLECGRSKEEIAKAAAKLGAPPEIAERAADTVISGNWASLRWTPTPPRHTEFPELCVRW